MVRRIEGEKHEERILRIVPIDDIDRLPCPQVGQIGIARGLIVFRRGRIDLFAVADQLMLGSIGIIPIPDRSGNADEGMIKPLVVRHV